MKFRIPSAARATAVSLAGAAMALSLGAAGANATVTYNYVGSPFTTETNWTGASNLTGSVTLDAPLAANLNFADVTPLSFSFSDGLDTITNLNATGSQAFDFKTDASGAITDWGVVVFLTDADFITSLGPHHASGPLPLPADHAVFGTTNAENTVVGAWSVAGSGVPEPAAWAMMLVGFGALGGVMRRRRALAAA